MSNRNVKISLEGNIIENITEYVYLRHNVITDKGNQTLQITPRIGLRWTSSGKLNCFLKTKNKSET